jgi:TrmH family RNA methyltransferase
MISKNKQKLIRSLDSKKNRVEHSLFVVEGVKMVTELIQAQKSSENSFKIEELFYTQQWADDNIEELKHYDFPSELIKDSELEKISQFKTPNQVLATVKIPPVTIPDFPEETVLILDGIKDPGNMGTIIRTADWFGINHIICSSDCVDLYNPKTVQATMGSLFRVSILYYDLIKALRNLRRHHPLKPILGATLQGQNVYQMPLPQHAFVLMGSESHGIRPEAREFVTKEIKIPQFGGGESLNVATAAAILCSEFRRG